MKISEFYTYAPKSRIKAGDANPNGKYQFYTSSPDENRRCDEYLYDCKAIVMGTGGSATIHYYDGKFSTSTDCLVLVPNEKIRAKYLYYFFLGNMSTLEAGFKGAGLKHTNKGYIDSIEIAKIPPLSKQDEIIELFDKLISRIKKQQNQIERLDELVKARFVEMFGDPITNGKGFPIYRMDEVVSFQGGSQPDKKFFEYEPTDDNIRLIQIRDYRTDKYKTYIPKELAKRFCTKDDIMIGRYGPPIFQILKGIEGSFNVALMKATPKMGNREFIRYFLKQECLLRYLEGMSQRTAGQDGIQMDKLKEYPFPMPPLGLQEDFEKIVAQVDKSKFAISQSLLLLIKALSASFISHSEQISALLSSRDKAG